MRSKILNYLMKTIKKKYPSYSEEKLEEIEYGLEAIYITITKTIVLFTIAFILKIAKEMLLILIFYNLIRTVAFGMHAKKSWHCYIISGVLFIGAAIVAKYVEINFLIKFIISSIAYIFLIIYAPADTYKRPLINAKKRKKYKILTYIISTIYLILIYLLKDYNIINYLMWGMVDSMIMIHPLTYRMFHLPYNNYKNYKDSYN